MVSESTLSDVIDSASYSPAIFIPDITMLFTQTAASLGGAYLVYDITVSISTALAALLCPTD